MTATPEEERDSIYERMQVEDIAAQCDITGCPVPWCDDAGEHWWPHELDGSRTVRIHEHEVWSSPMTMAHGATVSVEMMESEGLPHGDDEDIAVSLLANDLRFTSADEVREFIAGLLQAASIAFPGE